MAIRSFTYKDIPAARRQETVVKIRARMQDRLSDRSLTSEQRVEILEQLSLLDEWTSDNKGDVSHG